MPIVGDVLAERYRIDGVLGAGGMASVYLATDLRLDRQVAVKVLLPNLARDPSLAGRFDREARMLAAVAHPSVAAIFDVEPGDAEVGREPFYVMELCDGGSLADRIEADGALDPLELVPIIGAVAEGLAELHRSSVVHQDVKPGNILFSGGRAKLADFGLAKSDGTPDATTLTAPGTMVGTLPYLAPELLAGSGPTAASDVYALGATTFHALTGRLPKPFDSIGRFVDARWTPAPTASSVLPGLGSAFDGPLGAALAIDPAARPPAAQFAEELRAALASHSRAGPDAAATGGAGAGAGAAGAALIGASTAGASTAGASTAGASTAGASPIDPPTLVLSPSRVPPSAAPARTSRDRAWRGSGPGVSWPTVAALGAVVLVLVLVLLALNNLAGIGTLPVLSPGASPSPSPSLPASPTPEPSATPDPAAPALEALDRVLSAIEQARGGKDGLGGGEAHDLQALAFDVQQALRSSDFPAAREAAQKLEDRAVKVTEKIDPARRDALLRAIDELQAAIPAG